VSTDDVGEELLRRAVLRLNGTVLGLVFGIILGLLIFVATNWLVIKGGPVVGPHLSLLSQFFIGYSVTFLGSLIGMAYGLVTGFLIGFFIGWLYNRVVAFRST
jgi:tetrahydromethanopterin S-methyltransferase subunit G